MLWARPGAHRRNGPLLRQLADLAAQVGVGRTQPSRLLHFAPQGGVRRAQGSRTRLRSTKDKSGCDAQHSRAKPVCHMGAWPGLRRRTFMATQGHGLSLRGSFTDLFWAVSAALTYGRQGSPPRAGLHMLWARPGAHRGKVLLADEVADQVGVGLVLRRGLPDLALQGGLCRAQRSCIRLRSIAHKSGCWCAAYIACGMHNSAAACST